MTFARLLIDGLRHHWRMHVAVALGVAVGTAVLSGALLVGDSVRGSLRSLTLDRLGQIDEVLVSERFFREELSHEVAQQERFHEYFTSVVPAILLRGTVEAPRSDARAVAGNVSVIGCDPDFWKLGDLSGFEGAVSAGGIVLNKILADELAVRPGDEVILRLPAPSSIPADSPLGRKSDAVRSRRLPVQAVIPARGLGRFGLRASQQLPKNAYVSLELLQESLGNEGRVNALLVCGKGPPGATPPVEGHQVLTKHFRPKLEDFGVRLELEPAGYFNFTSDRMMLDPPMVEAAMNAWAAHDPQPVLVYLANTIAKGDRSVPYSIVAAVDPRTRPPLGPFRSPGGEPVVPWRDVEIVVNSWTAEQLGAQIGDTIELAYFEPESTHGEVREHVPPARFRLAAIVALEGLAADPHFTPELPGVTDQKSIQDWNPPFPFDGSRVRGVDERYWDDYRTTPKAFITLAAGRKLFASRFGDTTSLRIPYHDTMSVGALAAEFRPNPERLGLSFQPVKRQGLEASAGTTPFDALFLAFSMFLVVAAVMLVALLFRLGVDRRVSELGILAAVGWRATQARRLFLCEAALVAAAGGALGVILGVGYAWLILAGLRTWWLAAVRTPFLELHITTRSLWLGWAAGLIVSLGTIWISLRSTRRLAIRELLAGRTATEPGGVSRRRTGLRWGAAALLFLAVLWIVTSGAEALAFFGAGAAMLAAGLLQIHASFYRPTRMTLPMVSLLGLSWQNVARHPIRSTLTMGLMAAAAFLIVAVGAFQLAPSLDGAGGFRLIAECDQPIFADLNTPAGRESLGIPPDAEDLLETARFVPIKVAAGDDASCLNLYKPRRPRILGVDPARMGNSFAWAATPHRDFRDAWQFLKNVEADQTDIIDGTPEASVVLDTATATYSLHLGGVGTSFEAEDERGQPLRMHIVGLLQNSIFQGDVIMSQDAFLKHFPNVSGYNMFLIDVPAQSKDQVRAILEDALSDYGFDVQDSTRRLADLMAVQNTYLQTFQSLGALGLLLGTVGMVTVQLRSVLERRGELALMRAAGFRRRRLGLMVILENASLLLGGLSLGVVAAVVAILPQMLSGRAEIPWGFLALTLALVVLVGLTAGMTAVRAALNAPLLPALRGD